MMAGSLQGKVMQMEDQMRDMEAESELEKLEQRLGMRPTTVAAEETATVMVSADGTAPEEAVAQSEAERQLAELEARLKSN
jgi:phage shock protein A